MGPIGMILCAGLGTRLRPLTDLLPKPAIPVADLPLIRYGLALLASAGVNRAVVNVHHLPEVMASLAVRSGREVGLEVEISREPVLAGTGGALREARALFEGASEILLLNGDILFDVDLASALESHRRAARLGALATMLLLPMPKGASYATVEIDREGWVRRIAGLGPPGERGLLTPWHFSGVHVLSPALLDRVPSEPFLVDVNRQVYVPLLTDDRVRGLVVSGYWNDLGTSARYLEATRDLLSGRIPLKRLSRANPFPECDLAPGAAPSERICAGRGVRVDPAARLKGPVLLGERAVVECGAEVGPFAVVGAGATVGAKAHVSDAVLWPGAQVGPGERVEHKVVTSPAATTSG